MLGGRPLELNCQPHFKTQEVEEAEPLEEHVGGPRWPAVGVGRCGIGGGDGNKNPEQAAEVRGALAV